MSKGCLKIDKYKLKVILNWPTPISIGDFRGFHGLTSFYMKFIRNYSHVITSILNTVKVGKCKFIRTPKVDDLSKRVMVV